MNVIRCDRCGKVIERGFKFQYQACQFSCYKGIKVWSGNTKNLDLCENCYIEIIAVINKTEEDINDKT